MNELIIPEQAVPLPVYPTLQAHEKEPMLSVQVASLFSAHSSIFEQETPVPVYPALQAHTNDPTLFVQLAFAWQLSVLSTHSSRSEQVLPSPV